MRIDTVLFDLDGTLLPFAQEEFIAVYLKKIGAVFAGLGLDAKFALRALWAGTDAMLQNDGTKYNSERFWGTFAAATALPDAQLRAVEDACDSFYCGEFDTVRSVLKPADPELPRRMVRALKARGFRVVLATNPLFPTCAVTTRLGWIGLTPDDFCMITDYANSTFCKPSAGYYRAIFDALGKQPQQCLMVGNSTRDDMPAAALGADVFLVADFLENEDGLDIGAFRHGTLAGAEAYLTALPGIL